ncbi:hypothetical protein CLAIMM_13920 [Cladophialophora immunda]|nr:hypothetical protein CLAIMM_13920 [Cladophialophora immunda]
MVSGMEHVERCSEQAQSTDLGKAIGMCSDKGDVAWHRIPAFMGNILLDREPQGVFTANLCTPRPVARMLSAHFMFDHAKLAQASSKGVDLHLQAMSSDGEMGTATQGHILKLLLQPNFSTS